MSILLYSNNETIRIKSGMKIWNPKSQLLIQKMAPKLSFYCIYPLFVSTKKMGGRKKQTGKIERL